jgi:hypothetical protein
MSHIYKKDDLQQQLNSLIGDSIEDVFYHLTYEDYKTFLQIQNEAQQTLLVGLLLKMVSGKTHGINGSNYICDGYRQHEIEGIHIELIKVDVNTSNLTVANHIFDEAWKQYRGRKITRVSLYEIVTIEEFVDRKTFRLIKKNGKTFTTPCGIKIEFENQSNLYMFNMEISSYSEKDDIYNFAWCSEEITIFFGDAALHKHKMPLDTNHTLQIFV